jgi:ATP/maltotriose-dependent transcriptional regulator MalT
MENARRAGFIVPLFVAPAYMADTYGELGALPEALDQLAQARALQAPVAHMYRTLLGIIDIHVHLSAGATDQAQALAGQYAELLAGPISYYARGSLYYLLGVVPAVRAELALLGGQPGQALAITDEAEGLTKHLAQRPLAEIRYWRARAQQALGDVAGARLTLEAARAQAERVGQPRLLWRILALQAELAQSAGETAQAEALRAQARTIVSAFAMHAGSPELQASYLARPVVRAVMGKA